MGSLMVLLIVGGAGRGLAADKSDIQEEIELLQERIQELEQRLDEQEAAGKKQARQAGQNYRRSATFKIAGNVISNVGEQRSDRSILAQDGGESCTRPYFGSFPGSTVDPADAD